MNEQSTLQPKQKLSHKDFARKRIRDERHESKHRLRQQTRSARGGTETFG